MANPFVAERASSRSALLSVLLASTMLTGVSAAKADTGIETVVVTAEKRTEDLQKVPMAIQVLGTQKITDLHIQSFADYAQYLPSVSFASTASGGGLNSPSFVNVTMRGVSSGGDGNPNASLPTVGIYLDEQPITTIGGSPDIHAYDIARIESLAGPQGTLYGASSEAGTIRIITNKPDPSAFAASVDVQANVNDTSGLGDVVQGFVNIPLADNAAIRIVGWQEHDAGYIDNVDGTDAAAGIVNGVRTFPVGGFQDNAVKLGNNYNTTDISGGRAALKIDLDDNWTITPSVIAQETLANGAFGFDPAVGDLKVVKFAPEFTHDNWVQAALTIQGKISDLDVTYAGAYMDRKVNSQQDYSDYSYFYDNSYGHYFTTNAGGTHYVNPSQVIEGHDHFTKDSQELRVASPSEDRLRFVAGLFYQRQFHWIVQNYQVADLGSDLTIPGWPHTLYLQDTDRVDRDYAAYTEISYDVLPSLTVTAGGRIFEADNSLHGFFGFSANWQAITGDSNGMTDCFPATTVHNGPCTDLEKDTVERGFTHKLNATWHIDDDDLVYFTWSNGFRPGGVNRVVDSSGSVPPYKPDYLMNYELGWKTSWLDNTLNFNGDIYLDEWKNFQFTFLGPNSIPIIANAGEAQIAGIESNAVWKATDHLTLDGSASYADAELTQNYCQDPPACTSGVLAPSGQQLPGSARFKANATARYNFLIDQFNTHVQGSVVYNGAEWDDLRTLERAETGRNPAYTIFNFTAGIALNNWSLDLSIENAFDERAQLYRYSECTPDVCGPQTYIIPTRPRTFGLEFSQNF